MARAQISLSQAQGFFEQGLYDRAKIMVNQAIDLNPNSPLAWQLLGNCLKKLGRDQEALSAYDQAIKLLSVAKDNAIAPTNPNSLNNSSQASTQIYSQSTNDIVQLWTERARTLDRLNRFQESVAAYDQALELRCQEQSLRINEPLPSVCENYLFPPPSANSPTPNNTNRSVIVPVSPSQQPTTPSKPNRTVW
jgi:tetratricopeptide (TPR) repeat protein